MDITQWSYSNPPKVAEIKLVDDATAVIDEKLKSSEFVVSSSVNSPVSLPLNMSESDSDVCGEKSEICNENESKIDKFKIASEVLTNGLSDWILHEKKVHHKSVDRLLKILGNNFEVPKSSKSLFKYSHPLDIESMGNGSYLHLSGWYSNLMDYYMNQYSSSYDELDPPEINSHSKQCGLLVNVDGLPIYNLSLIHI